MKKFLYITTIISAAVFASCQNEKLDDIPSESTVRYTIQLPEDMKTKIIGDEAPAQMQLVYEVWRTDVDGDIQFTEADRLLYHKDDATISNGTASIDIQVLKDQSSTVLFWAQVKDNGVYNVEKLTEVQFVGSAANNGDAVVFSGVDFIKKGESLAGRSVNLTRPVAQLNIATTPESLKEFKEDIEIKKSSLSVRGLYSAFNVAEQTPVGQPSVNAFTYTEADAPTGSLPVNSKNYTYAGMNYLGFIPANGTNVDLSFTIVTSDGNISHQVKNVPVKPNYRTNIIGNLITASSDYDVVLNPDWADEEGEMEIISEGLVKNINGDYEISSAAGLAYAVNKLFVKDGAANPATFYIYPDIYDMAQQEIEDLNIPSGTLRVYDMVPVVTRSAERGVIITGLKKALIKTVSNGAVVFFSGITVKDYNETGAALVAENDGKVVLAGCSAVDENNDPVAVDLVSGNDPVVIEEEEEDPDGLIYSAAQLAEAFKNAEAESVIGLGANIALDTPLTFPEGRKATLDLRGWELTFADESKVSTTYAICNFGDLTIKDSFGIGAVKARGIYNGYDAKETLYPNAKLTIESGSFNSMGDNGGSAVFNYGIADIKGGNFTSIGGYSLNNREGSSMTVSEGVTANNGIYNSEAALTINGGEIEGNRSGCHVVYAWNSTVTINGGSLTNQNSGNATLMSEGSSVVTINAGTFSIKDGRVEGNGNTWTSYLTDIANDGKIIVNGGTFNGGCRVQQGSMTIAGGTFNDTVGSGYNVYEGGSVVITGGTYTDDAAKNFALKYVCSGYELVGENVVRVQQNNEIWYTSYEMKLEPTTPEALGVNIVSNEWDRSTGKGVITFDAPLTVIGNNAFKYETNTTPSNWMTTISLPKSVTTIGAYAFSQCYSLTNITIPDSVISVGEYAFQSCNAVTNVTIGASVQTIASSAFYNCYEIKEVVCKSATPPTIADKYVFSGTEIAKVVVPAASVDAYKAAQFWSNYNIVSE